MASIPTDHQETKVTQLPVSPDSGDSERQPAPGPVVEDRIGRPPEISDEDVYEACSMLFQRGVEPKKINGYKIRKHFGKGNPGRFDRIAQKWRDENRYDQPVQTSAENTAQENPLKGAIEALTNVKTAIETGAKTLQYRHTETLKKTEEKAKNELKEAGLQAHERESDAQGIIDELEKSLEETTSRLQKTESRSQQLEGLLREALEKLQKLEPEYKELKERAQSVAAVERERDQAKEACKRAESQLDEFKAEAKERESYLKDEAVKAGNARDELISQLREKDSQLQEKDQRLVTASDQLRELQDTRNPAKGSKTKG